MPVPAERLTALPLFSTLTADERERVAHWFEQRSASPGARLTVEGASGYSFFVLESGSVDVERGGEVLETLGPGDFFGEAAILSGARRNATVSAATQTALLVLFGTEFRLLEQELPEAAAKIRQKMAERAPRP